MKKVLEIVVLVLLLSGNAYAKDIYLNCSRTIYENNGEGEWSLYYKEGQSDQSILISIKKQILEPTTYKEKEIVVKMVVHLAENDSGEPEKIFKGKGLFKNGHYIVKKKHKGKTFINTWFLKDYGVTKMKASDKIDVFKKENEWIIEGVSIRKFDIINVNYKYKGECNSLTKDEYLKASK